MLGKNLDKKPTGKGGAVATYPELEKIVNEMRFNPTVNKLLDKASEIVNLGTIQKISEEDGYTVTSLTRDRTYSVHPESGCTCEATQFGKGICKHEVAVKLWKKLERTEVSAVIRKADKAAMAKQHIEDIWG